MHIAECQRSQYPASLVTVVTSSVYIHEYAVVSAAEGRSATSMKVCCGICNPLIVSSSDNPVSSYDYYWVCWWCRHSCVTSSQRCWGSRPARASRAGENQSAGRSGGRRTYRGPTCGVTSEKKTKRNWYFVLPSVCLSVCLSHWWLLYLKNYMLQSVRARWFKIPWLQTSEEFCFMLEQFGTTALHVAEH